MKSAEKVVKLASNQVPFSMINRGIEKELVPYCIEHKRAILAYSPLQRGLLTGKIGPGHRFGEGDNRGESRWYQPENVVRVNKFLDELRPLAAAKNASLAQLVIRWTLERPGITIALVGARNAEQAVQNAKAIEVKLSGEEIGFINKRLEGLGVLS
jgi:aryl-alcohol dehydrogenase-like predicted oxidoreductase